MNGGPKTEWIWCGSNPVEITVPADIYPPLGQITYAWMDAFWEGLSEADKERVRDHHSFDPRTYDPANPATFVRDNCYYLHPYFPFRSETRVGPIPHSKADAFSGLELGAIRRPSSFGTKIRGPHGQWILVGEEIAKLDSQTWVVEVSRPPGFFEIGIPGVGSGVALQSVAIRGWYIKGSMPRKNALVVVYNGRGEELLQKDPTRRNIIARLVRDGFDVWSPDLRGHGVSEGICSLDNAAMAMDVFGALSQFETGKGVKVRTPGGDTLDGLPADGLLPYAKASETPVLLYGQSQGTMVMIKAMTLHLLASERLVLRRPGAGHTESRFADYFRPQFRELVQACLHLGGARGDQLRKILEYGHPATPSPATIEAAMELLRQYYAAFDIRGVISIDGHEGNRVADWLDFALGVLNRNEFALEDLPPVDGVSIARPPGVSIPPGLGAAWDAVSFLLQARWPAHLQIHGTADEMSPPLNAIEGYNLERGLKEVLILQGHHDILVQGGNPATVPSVIDTIAEFASAALSYSGGLINAQQTTLLAEVCRTAGITPPLRPWRRRLNLPPWPPLSRPRELLSGLSRNLLQRFASPGSGPNGPHG